VDVLLTVIVTWLAANFGLPANYDHPSVAFLPTSAIAQVRYGSHEKANNAPAVIAVYDTGKQVILLSDGWSAISPADVSVLVHEMVHHLQTKAGLKYNCNEAREAMAYAAQAKWLGQSGTDMDREFGIDSFTIKVRTSCLSP